MIHDAAKSVSSKLLEPLCEATARMFLPLRLSPDDRLSVKLAEGTKWFEVNAYGLKPLDPRARIQVEALADEALPWVHEGLLEYSDAEAARWAFEAARNEVEDPLREAGFPSYEASTQFLRRIPEARVLADYAHYKIAATDTSALIMNALWPADQLNFAEDARVVYDYLLARFLGQTRALQAKAAYRELGKAPTVRFIDNVELPLAEYQRVGYAAVHDQEAAALFMEQGTGKTPIAIARICNEGAENNNGHMYKALIVAPKNVRANWKNEFIRFATVPGKVTVLRGGQLKRVKLLLEAVQSEDDCKWSAVVCSYEAIGKSWEALRMIEWDLCILDESHYIKSSSTQRYKKAKQLRELCAQRMCMTGTPSTGRVFDLYTQFEFLGEGLSGFTSYEAFKQYYGKWKRTKTFDVLTGYKNIPLLQERLARLAYMIRKSEALPSLPDKVYDVVEVEMTKAQAEAYSQLQAQLAIEIEAESKMLTATNILTRLLRLAQITSGFIVWDPQYDEEGEQVGERRVDRIDPNPKLEALVELMRGKPAGSKTIVWACWVQDIRSIAARLALEGLDCVTFYGSTSEEGREVAERRFNADPKCQVFIGNPSAGGVGLNLLGYDYTDPKCKDRGCDHVVYYSQGWSMTARAQSEDRSHRMGTRHHVRYTDLCVPGSIDEEIRSRVTQKRLTALALQDVHNIMTRVLGARVEVGD